MTSLFFHSGKNDDVIMHSCRPTKHRKSGGSPRIVDRLTLEVSHWFSYYLCLNTGGDVVPS